MALGIDGGEVVSAEVDEEEEMYAVWEENWPLLEIFLRLVTQWRVGMAGATGLDYGSLDVVFRLYDVPLTKETFEIIQQMEVAVLRVFNEKAEVERARARQAAIGGGQ